MNNAFRFALRTVPLSVVTGASALSVYKIYQHSFGVENECIKMSCYGDLSTPLDTNTQIAVDKVIDRLLLLQVNPRHLANTEFYWNNKPTVQYAGCTMSRFGTYIGIPLHYRYQNPSQVDLTDLQTTSLDDTKLLDRLKELLVLSENAKKFAISSAFFSADSFHLFAKGDIVVTIFGFYFTMTRVLLPLVGKASPPLAFLLTVIAGCVWTAIHYYVNGLLNTGLTAKSDRKTAELGDDFLEGGLEYLSKMAEKNKIMRELKIEAAELRFQSNGDEIQGMFDIRELMISERLRRLQRMKEKFQQKDSTVTENETS